MDNGARDCALFCFLWEKSFGGLCGRVRISPPWTGAVRKNLRKSKPAKMGNQVEARSKKKHRTEDRPPQRRGHAHESVRARNSKEVQERTKWAESVGVRATT